MYLPTQYLFRANIPMIQISGGVRGFFRFKKVSNCIFTNFSQVGRKWERSEPCGVHRDCQSNRFRLQFNLVLIKSACSTEYAGTRKKNSPKQSQVQKKKKTDKKFQVQTPVLIFSIFFAPVLKCFPRVPNIEWCCVGSRNFSEEPVHFFPYTARVLPVFFRR